jgi:hypothetical protein
MSHQVEKLYLVDRMQQGNILLVEVQDLVLNRLFILLSLQDGKC